MEQRVSGLKDVERAYYIFSSKRYNTIIFCGIAIALALIKPLSMISVGAGMCTLLILLLALVLAYRWSIAEVLVNFRSDGLDFQWTKNFRFRPEENFHLDFLTMQDWAVDTWTGYHYYRFTMQDGRTVKIVLHKKSIDSYEFKTLLVARINAYNAKYLSPQIVDGKTYFQRPAGKALAIGLAIVLIICWTYFYPNGKLKVGKLIMPTIIFGFIIVIAIRENLSKRS